ncbi:hypothetical protein SJAV_01020 [Sulfurisphaera javensis]|uniref:Uncharacterized protein n=1 Tax=Sulfurisphaera javensis TaxID=2049879 RepID=A0AAT9GN65_9CREN
MRSLKYFSVFYTIYGILSLLDFYFNEIIISIIAFVFGFTASFFLRKEFKALISRQEFRIPYAGAYLMILGYLGIIVGIPVSYILVVHLLGLTLVLVGALFVDIGILTALVLGNYRLSSTFKRDILKIVAIIFLVGVISSFYLEIVADILYVLGSLLILVVFL